MSFNLGIVGLPNVGKSTLFNALSKAGAEVKNYPFCTIDPNVGVVEVPDERLGNLSKLFSSAKTVPTVIEFYDIAGLVKGAHKGEGLGNQFLAHIREVDAIVHVVRCFPADDIIHVEGTIDPKRDVGLIEAELILADLASVEKRLLSSNKGSKTGDKKAKQDCDLLVRLKPILEEGKPARSINPTLTPEEQKTMREFFLLTAKPVLYAANVDETGNKENVAIVQKMADEEGAKLITICSKLEAEIAELPEEEAKAYLKEMGMEDSALHKLIKASYELLGLITFFTAGEKESRAWTITRGTKAPQAAGKIHSDMEKGFIAADVVAYQDMINEGSYAKVKEKGLLRTEGKNYTFQDGDIVIIKFNV